MKKEEPLLSWILKKVIEYCSKGKHGNKLNIITYHRVEGVEGLEDPNNPAEFSYSLLKSQLKWLKKHFKVYSLPKALELIELGTLPSGSVCITIDDGYDDCYNYIFKALLSENMLGNFFITTEGFSTGNLWDDRIKFAISQAPNNLTFIKLDDHTFDISTFNNKKHSQNEIIKFVKYMPMAQRNCAISSIYQQTSASNPSFNFVTKDQIKEMHQAGMIIGAHTHNHPIMSVESDEVVTEQIQIGKDILEDIIGEKVEYFAYPNGKLGADFNEHHSEILKKIGFKAALSTEWGSLEDLSRDRFKIKRFTPWDKAEWRFCFRLAFNYRHKNEK